MSGREADSVRDSTIQKQELKSEIKRTVMKKITKKLRYVMAAFVAATALPVLAKPPAPRPQFNWNTVVNNNDVMPPSTTKKFNSYNQPSVNVDGTGGHPGPEQRR